MKKKIHLFSSPMETAKAGRSRDYPFREDWELIKDEIMHFVLLEKFPRKIDAERLLLSTANAELIEPIRMINIGQMGVLELEVICQIKY
ncbi:hypothetical protein ACOZZ3_003979 [Cronobacter dublinensis]